MSRLKGFRIVNLQYRKKHNHIRDEEFVCIQNERVGSISGHTTLVLGNGGGKSVMTQTLISAYLNNRDQKLGERSFSDYVNESPLVIMQEHLLDNNNDILLVGVVARKGQKAAEEETDNKPVVQAVKFLAKYPVNSIVHAEYEMHEMQFIRRNTEGRDIMMTYQEIVDMFKKFHAQAPGVFEYYNNYNHEQMTRFRQCLCNHGIYPDEWKNIMHTYNVKEGGVTKITEDCKTTRLLLEKHIGKTITDIIQDLSEEKKDIFTPNIMRYLRNRKRDQATYQNLKEYEDLARSLEHELMPAAAAFAESREAMQDAHTEIGQFYGETCAVMRSVREKEEKAEEEIIKLTEERKKALYEKYSLDFYDKKSLIEGRTKEIDELEKETIHMLERHTGLAENIAVQEAAKVNEDRKTWIGYLEKDHYKLRIAREDEQAIEADKQMFGGALWGYYHAKEADINAEIAGLQTELSVTRQTLTEQEAQKKDLERGKEKSDQTVARIRNRIARFDAAEDAYNNAHKNLQLERTEYFGRRYPENTFSVHFKKLDTDTQDAEDRLTKTKAGLHTLQAEKEELRAAIEDKRESLTSLRADLSAAQERLGKLREEETIRHNIAEYVSIRSVYDKEEMIRTLQEYVRKEEMRYDNLQTDHRAAFDKLDMLMTIRDRKPEVIPREIVEELEEDGIYAESGMEYLLNHPEDHDIIHIIPELPFAMVIDDAELPKLLEHKKIATVDHAIPVVLKQSQIAQRQPGTPSLYTAFDDRLLKPDMLEDMIRRAEEETDRLGGDIEECRTYIDKLKDFRYTVEHQELSGDMIPETEEKKDDIDRAIKRAEDLLSEMSGMLDAKDDEILQVNNKINDMNAGKEKIRQHYAALQEMQHKYEAYLTDDMQLDQETEHINSLKSRITQADKKISEIRTAIDDITARLHEQNILKTKNGNELETYLAYEGSDLIAAEHEVESYRLMYLEAERKSSNDVRSIESEIAEHKKKRDEKEEEINRILQAAGLDMTPDALPLYDSRMLAENRLEQESVNDRLRDIRYQIKKAEEDITVTKKKISDIMNSIISECEHADPMPKEECAGDHEARIAEYGKTIDKLKHDRDMMHEIYLYYKSCADKMEHEKEYAIPGEAGDILTEKELSDKRILLVERAKNAENEYQSADRAFRKTNNEIRKRFAATDADAVKSTLDAVYAFFDNGRDVTEIIHEKIKILGTLISTTHASIRDSEQVLEQITDELMKRTETFHEHLRKIDADSGIQLYGKIQKMMTCKPPVWTDYAPLARERAKSLMSELIKEYMDCTKPDAFEKRLRDRVSYVNLYNSLIGFDKVKIRFLKVLEGYTESVTWEGAVQASGGEETLFCVVALTNLMAYQRKCQHGAFDAGKLTSWKILLLDNPFGKLSSKHLLRALYAVAEKTHTQLVCFTALTEAAILNQADTVFSLRNTSGMKQYLYIQDVIINSDTVENMEQASLRRYLSEQDVK